MAKKNKVDVKSQIADMLAAGPREDVEPDEKEEPKGEEEEEEEEEEEGEPDEEEEEKEEDDEEEELDEEDAEEEDEEDEEEGEAEEEDDEEDTTDEVGDLKRQVEALQKRLDSKLTPPKETPDRAEEEPEPPKYKEQEFIKTDADYDEMLGSRENLNALLNQVANHSFDGGVEATMQRIPAMISNAVAAETTTQQMIFEFFDSHEDLKPVKRYVATRFEDLLGENPEWTYEEALAETAKTVRSELGLARAGSKKSKKKSRRKRPSMPDGSRSRGPRLTAPKGIRAEIDAMAGV